VPTPTRQSLGVASQASRPIAIATAAIKPSRAAAARAPGAPAVRRIITISATATPTRRACDVALRPDGLQRQRRNRRQGSGRVRRRDGRRADAGCRLTAASRLLGACGSRVAHHLVRHFLLPTS